MKRMSSHVSRRQFNSVVGAMGATALVGHNVIGAEATEKPLKLGIDNFAVRATGWKAKQLIDYAGKLDVDTLFITDLYAFENFDDSYLRGLRSFADDKNVKLYVGTWSICPTSRTFKQDWGTAEEHLSLGIRVARILGSPVIRVILGSRQDRLSEGGIRARIADTAEVLKAKRGDALDAEVKVAVENHAGDMHSLELVDLVEAGGTDFVGVNLDSGNAVWTLEDPLQNLENLGRYVLTSSLRDTTAWKSDNGVTAQWTAMGEGKVDWETYFSRFRELCPDAPVNIETISGFNHELAIKKDDFWKAWPDGQPDGFDTFLQFADKGSARPPRKRTAGVDPKQDEQAYQRGELERSIAFCRRLGLGIKKAAAV